MGKKWEKMGKKLEKNGKNCGKNLDMFIMKIYIPIAQIVMKKIEIMVWNGAPNF
jgi:hypothetical protein